MTWRSFYRRRAKHATAVAAAALSESTPPAIGIRTGVASASSSSLNPARSEPIRMAARAGRSRSSIDRGVRVGRQGENLEAVEGAQFVGEVAASGRGGVRTPFPSPPAAIGGRAGRRWCDRGSGRPTRTPPHCG